jgi:hypothetical protein
MLKSESLSTLLELCEPLDCPQIHNADPTLGGNSPLRSTLEYFYYQVHIQVKLDEAQVVLHENS